jgi:hypothetical protein
LADGGAKARLRIRPQPRPPRVKPDARTEAERDRAMRDYNDDRPAVLFGALPSGVIAGAVFASACRSAGLAASEAARRAGAYPGAASAWAQGTVPLCVVEPAILRRLSTGLLEAGATPKLVADLPVASDCDMLVFGVVHGFDDFLAEVPPVDDPGTGQAARELLTWALHGKVPGRYAPYAAVGRPLVDAQTHYRFALGAHALAWHMNDEARSVGRALVAVACAYCADQGHVTRPRSAD